MKKILAWIIISIFAVIITGMFLVVMWPIAIILAIIGLFIWALVEVNNGTS